MAIRCIVAGSRDFKNYKLLVERLDFYFSKQNVEAILSGNCRGADALGERYAKMRGINLELYPAQWDEFGFAAGPIRNRVMAERATHLVLFWNGSSSGSSDMLRVAKEFNLVIREVRI